MALHTLTTFNSYLVLLQKPIIPPELYRAVRDSQLVGLSGYSKEVHKYNHIVLQYLIFNTFSSYPTSNKYCILLPKIKSKFLPSGNLLIICSFPLYIFSQGLPVIAVGVGQSTFDKASVRIFFPVYHLYLA